MTIGQLMFVAAKGKNALDCANEIKKIKRLMQHYEFSIYTDLHYSMIIIKNIDLNKMEIRLMEIHKMDLCWISGFTDYNTMIYNEVLYTKDRFRRYY